MKLSVAKCAVGFLGALLISSYPILIWIPHKSGELGHLPDSVGAFSYLLGLLFCLLLLIWLVLRVGTRYTRYVIVISICGAAGGMYGFSCWNKSWLAGFANYAKQKWNVVDLQPMLSHATESVSAERGWDSISDKMIIAQFNWNDLDPVIRVLALDANRHIFHVRWIVSRDSKVGWLFSSNGSFPDRISPSKPISVYIAPNVWVYVTGE